MIDTWNFFTQMYGNPPRDTHNLYSYITLRTKMADGLSLEKDMFHDYYFIVRKLY
jgi:hypothetical protein